MPFTCPVPSGRWPDKVKRGWTDFRISWIRMNGSAPEDISKFDPGHCHEMLFTYINIIQWFRVHNVIVSQLHCEP